jgi:EAL domain-containing protein (putative c-di-GMP-specific phosphodiesterase class I)
LRWNHPEFGLVEPNYFIEHAEESRIIEQLSEWVLHRVATDLFGNEDFLASGIKVSINLSASDIRNKKFPENLVALTQHYGIEPKRLEIEITENMFMSDIQACTHKLQVLSNKGISIAIDDFGTGYWKKARPWWRPSSVWPRDSASISLPRASKTSTSPITWRGSAATLCRVIFSADP